MTTGDCVEGVVAVIRRNGRFLVIRRAEAVVAPGAWCLPGGAIEAGESATDALVREIREEVSLSIRPQCEIWQWLREDGRLMLHWWLAVTDDPMAEPVPNPQEVAEARWVTAAEFRALDSVLPTNLLFLDHCEHLLG